MTFEDGGLAFDPEKCDIAEVPRIPNEHILQDDTLPDDPLGLQACDAAPIDPLADDPPCPVLRPDSLLDGWQVFEVPYQSVSDNDPPQLRWRFIKGDCCDFDLEIDLNLPCVRLRPDEPETISATMTDGPTVLRVWFERDTTEGTCDHTLQAELDVHCIDILPQAPVVSEIGDGGSLVYYFEKDAETCDYYLRIHLDLGDITTAGCPTIHPEDEWLYASFSDVMVGYTRYMFVRDPDACEFELELDTVFTGFTSGAITGSVVVTTNSTGAPSGTINFSFPGSLNINLSLPMGASLVHVTSNVSEAGGWPGFVYINNGDGTWGIGPECRAKVSPQGGDRFEEGDHVMLRNGTVTVGATVYPLFFEPANDLKSIADCDESDNEGYRVWSIRHPWVIGDFVESP